MIHYMYGNWTFLAVHEGRVATRTKGEWIPKDPQAAGDRSLARLLNAGMQTQMAYWEDKEGEDEPAQPE